ncbi:hypothetical protein DFQ27_004799, partial [Actinomortierella ambigua]
YASIFAWLNAQIPQIIENFKLGSAGDLCNLLGCYLTNQLPFQKYLAIYFCVADIILFGQWIYYTRQHNRRKTLPNILIASLPEISEMGFPTSTSRPQTPPLRIETSVAAGAVIADEAFVPKRTRSTTITGASLRGGYLPMGGEDEDLEHGIMPSGGGGEQFEAVAPLMQRTRTRRATYTEEIAHRRSTSIVLFGLLFLTLRSTVPAGSSTGTSVASAGKMLMMAGRVMKRQDNYDGSSITGGDTPEAIDPAVHQLGRIFAWVCTIFYLTSRMPQLWKNYERKSVQGLSILMFFWAAMGNFTYALSILNSPAAVNPETSRQFLKEAVPYILGSSGTLMFDVSIFLQWLYYSKLRRRQHGRRHHHHHHRRRRSSRHLSQRQSRAQSRPETVCLSHPSSHLGTPRATAPGGYSMLVDQDDETFLSTHHGEMAVDARDL